MWWGLVGLWGAFFGICGGGMDKRDKERNYGEPNIVPAFIKNLILFKKDCSAEDTMVLARLSARRILDIHDRSRDEEIEVKKSLKPHLKMVYREKSIVSSFRW